MKQARYYSNDSRAEGGLLVSAAALMLGVSHGSNGRF